MKRIVDGTTYNTDTATAIAESECLGEHDDPEDGKELMVLYQTRGGAFFVHEQTTRKVWNERADQWEYRTSDTFVPLSSEGAHQWMMETGDVEVFTNPFEDPPEAEAETEPGSTIYLRVPDALKRRVEEAAAKAGTSANVWAMRCIETCLRSSA